GYGREINGVKRHNLHVPIPPELRDPSGGLRWVYNGTGPRFDHSWSDGGLQDVKDPRRLANLDIIQSFLHQIKPGMRARALIHPQRWGHNVDMKKNPWLAQQPWYRRICEGAARKTIQTARQETSSSGRWDQRAADIASKAKQKNVAQPRRSTRDFDRI